MAIGEIIQVIGPTVDIRFPEREVPKLLNAVKIIDAEKNINLRLLWRCGLWYSRSLTRYA